MKDVTYGRRSLRSAPGFRILGKKENGLMQIAETISSSMFIFECSANKFEQINDVEQRQNEYFTFELFLFKNSEEDVCRRTARSVLNDRKEGTVGSCFI